MRLWCVDVLSPEWMCVDVQCGKKPAVLRYIIIFHSGRRSSSKGSQIEDFYVGFGSSFSIRRFLRKRNLRCLKDMENRAPKTQKGPVLAVLDLKCEQ